MTGFYTVLQELVAWRADQATVLTLYLDLTGDDALDRARERVADAVEGTDLEGLDVERLGEAIQSSREAGYFGLAWFCCADPALDELVSIRFHFEDQALVGRDPHLRQLLFFAEEYEQCLCVVIGADRAQVCELAIGDLIRTSPVVPTHGRSLGVEVNIHLTRVLRDHPRAHVVLAGDDGSIEAALSPAVRDAVIDRIARVEPEEPGFLPRLHQALQDYERRVEDIGISWLMEQRDHGGDVAVGLDQTLVALNEGRVRSLFVLHDFEVEGWICDACDTLGGPPQPPVCVVCGASTSRVSLQEHVLDQAARCGADIESVDDDARLASIDGIGAILG